MPEPIGTKVYDIGDGVRSSVTFKVSGVATDPTTVTFKFKSPTGTVTTYLYLTDNALVRDGTGMYHAVIPVTESGTWWYRWEGTGSARGAHERMFQVRATQFGA